MGRVVEGGGGIIVLWIMKLSVHTAHIALNGIKCVSVGIVTTHRFAAYHVLDHVPQRISSPRVHNSVDLLLLSLYLYYFTWSVLISAL